MSEVPEHLLARARERRRAIGGETPHPKDSELALDIGLRTISLIEKSRILVQELADRKLHITAVESCTGGSLASFITCIPGSSAVMKGSFVTYSNEAKVELGVPEEIIEEHTVYSCQTALAMAGAGLRRSVRADIGVGITGSLSRVDPANENSVPGEVYLGIVYGELTDAKKLLVPTTDRMAAKLHVVENTIEQVLSVVRMA